MRPSKLKLILYWFLFIIGFYMFWLITYLLLARYALSEFTRFYNSKGVLFNQLKLDDVFWFFLFIAGITLSMYVIKQLIYKSPKPKIAAMVYMLLILVSELVLLNKLYSASINKVYVIPHLMINLLLILPMLRVVLRKSEELDN